MSDVAFTDKLNSLLTDKDFLELKSLQMKSNLFSNIAVSHLEMWHSAFIKWLIDPNSDFGLGTYPLQRFLYMVVYKGRVSEKIYEPKLNLGEIEIIDINNIEFENEFSFNEGDLSGRIDIIGSNDNLRITIENKVKASESKDQTKKYFEYLSKSTDNFIHDLYIFLSPDENKGPDCKNFIHITYQDLTDYVIRPCLNHPNLNFESKFLLEQYSYNLRKPLFENKKGGVVMALPNKELCEKIYEAHRDVLEEIFLSVKGEAPLSNGNKNKIRSNNATLNDLLQKNLLQKTDILYPNPRNYNCEAMLIESNNNIVIKLNDKEYSSPSAAGVSITGVNTNGWTFWNVKDSNGKEKGSLADLRSKL